MELETQRLEDKTPLSLALSAVPLYNSTVLVRVHFTKSLQYSLRSFSAPQPVPAGNAPESACCWRSRGTSWKMGRNRYQHLHRATRHPFQLTYDVQCLSMAMRVRGQKVDFGRGERGRLPGPLQASSQLSVTLIGVG